MAEKAESTKVAQLQNAVVLDRNRVQLEFVIEDLVKELAKGGISPVAACNGCNSCSASAPLIREGD